MLILSRKEGERIVIGGNIGVEVLEINGGRVRLAISAPREVPVDRFEVAVRKAREAKECESS